MVSSTLQTLLAGQPDSEKVQNPAVFSLCAVSVFSSCMSPPTKTGFICLSRHWRCTYFISICDAITWKCPHALWENKGFLVLIWFFIDFRLNKSTEGSERKSLDEFTDSFLHGTVPVQNVNVFTPWDQKLLNVFLGFSKTED